jgi:uncharacterized protein (DUF488 family)
VDVRTSPRSRRHPHFDGPALAAGLDAAGIVYAHLRDLGGFRRPRAESPHTGLRVDAFRGYADHMETEAFARAVERLLAWARAEPTAVMCAEADPARCHRRLLSDALAVRGVRVEHIVGEGERRAHALTAGARVVGGRLIYGAGGAAQASLFEG